MGSSRLITDIHTHVLPNVDDGPPDLARTKELLSSLYTSGVDRVISTSHYMSPHFDITKEKLRKAYDEAHSFAALNDAYPTLSLGAEVRISTRLRDDIVQNTVPTLGNTFYVLVEFASNKVTTENMEMIYELAIRGLKPIMAHPERNVAVQKNNKLLDELLDLGLLFQLTAECFIHRRSQAHMVEKLAWSILRNGQAALIASDAHNTTTRPPVLVPAYEAIASELGQQVVDNLIENANAVWNGTPCEPVPVTRAKRRFGLFAMNK